MEQNTITKTQNNIIEQLNNLQKNGITLCPRCRAKRGGQRGNLNHKCPSDRCIFSKIGKHSKPIIKIQDPAGYTFFVNWNTRLKFIAKERKK